MDYAFDFDSQLPALPLAFDLAAVARLFVEQWPRAGGEPPAAIGKCKLQDTKYTPALRCATTYALTVERPGAPPEPTIGVLEITPAGAAHRLYDDDPRLPNLAQATDPAAMRERFAALLPETAVESCAIAPVRYRPGVRCVFRYDLRTPAGAQTFFGKLFGEGAEQSMSTIAALDRARRSNPGMPRVLPPLECWADLQMLIQPAVTGGAELNDLAFDPAVDAATRERWLRDAGARLAGLHGCDSVAGPPRTIADDLDELREYIAPMAAVSPALAQQYQQTVERIAAQAAPRGEPAPVASHGAFRTDQFMIEDGELVMIDLDGFCWANPARDLGNFLAYLRWKAIRKPKDADFIERVGQVFLDGYQAAGRAIDQRWLMLYTADSMLKIAGRRYRSLTAKEWHLVPRLLDGALAALDTVSVGEQTA
ncbi:MAG: aminoglycoside phosphotransferase family protein [Kouleothrix sp.]|nr:aminoglycoside phosphotransferase family protein [Kouleothrix sp.]